MLMMVINTSTEKNKTKIMYNLSFIYAHAYIYICVRARERENESLAYIIVRIDVEGRKVTPLASNCLYDVIFSCVRVGVNNYARRRKIFDNISRYYSCTLAVIEQIDEEKKLIVSKVNGESNKIR